MRASSSVVRRRACRRAAEGRAQWRPLTHGTLAQPGARLVRRLTTQVCDALLDVGLRVQPAAGDPGHGRNATEGDRLTGTEYPANRVIDLAFGFCVLAC